VLRIGCPLHLLYAGEAGKVPGGRPSPGLDTPQQRGRQALPPFALTGAKACRAMVRALATTEKPMATRPVQNATEAARQARIAFEVQARLAREQQAARKAESSIRHARAQRRNIVRALVSAGILAMLLGLGFLTGIVSMPGGRSSPEVDARTQEFQKSKVGQIVFTPSQGDDCRQVSFSNTSGGLVGEKTVSCDELFNGSSGTAVGGSSRMDSLRAAFSKK
jgi:hypothetical protein